MRVGHSPQYMYYELLLSCRNTLIQVQWNLFITDISGPRIFDHVLLQYRVFPLSEVKNLLTRPVGTKLFVLIMEVFFYCVLNLGSLLREVPLYTCTTEKLVKLLSDSHSESDRILNTCPQTPDSMFCLLTVTKDSYPR